MVKVDVIFTEKNDLEVIVKLGGNVVFHHIFDLPNEYFGIAKSSVIGKQQNKGVRGV